MTPLAEILQKQILQHGPITVAEFMSQALGHPKHGYYMTRDPLGQKGDFITAPEISQMFGEMLGAWCADIWIKLGMPEKWHLVELGPGRGTLMSDMLRITSEIPNLHDSVSVHMVETSPTLKQAQKKALSVYDFANWYEHITEISFDAPVIFIANEFLDALPVHQYQKLEKGWAERIVHYEDAKGFYFGRTPTPLELGDAPKGAIKEISPVQDNYIQMITDVLDKHPGAALWIDYGHLETGFGDTLQALKNHKTCDVFESIGEADLTTHVDFENVKSLGTQKNMHVWGGVTQSYFLNALGISTRAHTLKANANTEQQQNIDSGLKRLVDDDEMGDLFKVMAFTHSNDLKPEGF